MQYSFEVLIPSYPLACSQAHSNPSVSVTPVVADMGKLAQETLGCQVEQLHGGLGGPNRARVLWHLVSGHPLLIPYPRALKGAGWGGRRVGPRATLQLWP